MGLQLMARSMLLPLYKGMISAHFILSGKMPSSSDWLKICQRGNVIEPLRLLSMILLILSCPQLDLLGRLLMILSISNGAVDFRTILFNCLGILDKYSSIPVLPWTIFPARLDPNCEQNLAKELAMSFGQVCLIPSTWDYTTLMFDFGNSVVNQGPVSLHWL